MHDKPKKLVCLSSSLLWPAWCLYIYPSRLEIFEETDQPEERTLTVTNKVITPRENEGNFFSHARKHFPVIWFFDANSNSKIMRILNSSWASNPWDIYITNVEIMMGLNFWSETHCRQPPVPLLEPILTDPNSSYVRTGQPMFHNHKPHVSFCSLIF